VLDLRRLYLRADDPAEFLRTQKPGTMLSIARMFKVRWW